MKTVLGMCVLLVVAASLPLQAQHAAYAEIGGSGIIPTVNYERRFSPNFAAHIGLGVVSASESGGDTDVTVALPLVGSYISHPQSNHHFEAGGGLLFVFGDAQDFDAFDEDDSVSNVAVTGLAGYRYQKPDRGFVFRATVTPVVYDGGVAPWAGLSFGYAW
jgi:hypothetical protein